MLSDTSSRRTEKVRRTLIPRPTFSPASLGRQKTRAAIIVISTVGIIVLTIKYPGFLLNKKAKVAEAYNFILSCGP